MKKIIMIILFILLTPMNLIANDCNIIMNDEQLDKIIIHMNNKADDMKNLNLIKTYLQRLCINTDQMLSILEVFKTKSIQNEFFLYSKEYIIDIENYNKLKIN